MMVVAPSRVQTRPLLRRLLQELAATTSRKFDFSNDLLIISLSRCRKEFIYELNNPLIYR